MPFEGPPAVVSPQARTTVPATGAVSWPCGWAGGGSRRGEAGFCRRRQVRTLLLRCPGGIGAGAIGLRCALGDQLGERTAQRICLGSGILRLPGGGSSVALSLLLTGCGGRDLLVQSSSLGLLPGMRGGKLRRFGLQRLDRTVET